MQTAPPAIPACPPRLVVFDLGGVMIRICSGWPEACGIASVPLPDAIRQQPILDRFTRLSHQHERGLLDNDRFAREAATLVGMPAEHLMAVAEAWLKGPYPGIDALVEQVRATGIATACLSNTNRIHWSLMTGPGRNRLPLHRLDHCFTSFDIGCMKPAGDIYAHVERVTGTPPEAILFFDDNGPNCAAAGKRGWQVCQIDPVGDTAQQMRQHLREAGIVLRD